MIPQFANRLLAGSLIAGLISNANFAALYNLPFSSVQNPIVESPGLFAQQALDLGKVVSPIGSYKADVKAGLARQAAWKNLIPAELLADTKMEPLELLAILMKDEGMTIILNTLRRYWGNADFHENVKRYQDPRSEKLQNGYGRLYRYLMVAQEAVSSDTAPMDSHDPAYFYHAQVWLQEAGSRVRTWSAGQPGPLVQEHIFDRDNKDITIRREMKLPDPFEISLQRLEFPHNLDVCRNYLQAIALRLASFSGSKRLIQEVAHFFDGLPDDSQKILFLMLVNRLASFHPQERNLEQYTPAKGDLLEFPSFLLFLARGQMRRKWLSEGLTMIYDLAHHLPSDDVSIDYLTPAELARLLLDWKYNLVTEYSPKSRGWIVGEGGRLYFKDSYSSQKKLTRGA